MKKSVLRGLTVPNGGHAPCAATVSVAFVAALLAAQLLPASCGSTPADPGGTPCPCKDGVLCVNSQCRPECKSGGCPGDTECVTVEGADLAVCLPPEDSLWIPMDAPKLPVPVDLLWSIENGVHLWKHKTALAAGFPQLVAALGGEAQVAIRTAVVSSLEPGFQSNPASEWPPSCGEVRTRECLSDANCSQQLGSAGWKCEAVSASKMVNLNGSINSSCVFRCGGDGECCSEFCFGGECGEDQSCVDEQCKDATVAPCSHECLQPGGADDNSVCTRPPISADCPPDVPAFLQGESLSLFRCLAVLSLSQSIQATLDQHLNHLWATLSPDGPHAEEAALFLRPDADLSVVFLGDEEDCSIDPDFASPNFTCEKDTDCPDWEAGLVTCRTDTYYSQLSGKPIKLCHGAIKKDYYNRCGLLGDFQGLEHHNCAYDSDCEDCQTDQDCPEWWYCKLPTSGPPASGGKCRPNLYGLPNIATFQNPPGSPIFSLAALTPFRERLLSLKKDPLQLFVAAIAGDGRPLPPDEDATELPSLISKACLADPKLIACAEFVQEKKTAPKSCILEPGLEDCHPYRTAKLACIRECYVASLGDPSNPTMAGMSYISYTDEFGKASLPMRLIRLAEMFGTAGAVYNFSAPGGIDAALLDLADRLNRRIYRACLPEGYTDGATVLLVRNLPDDEAGAGELLTQGPGGDYEVLPSWYACCPQGQPDCPTPGPAIQFHAMVEAGTTFEVAYVTP